MLFLESPAGVGFSINSDKEYVHDDISTSYDSLYAVINFFEKFPEYAKNPFFIAGESYAGKYIPDLTVLIDTYNNIERVKKINIKGIFIGNGVMNLQTIEDNTY